MKTIEEENEELSFQTRKFLNFETLSPSQMPQRRRQLRMAPVLHYTIGKLA